MGSADFIELTQALCEICPSFFKLASGFLNAFFCPGEVRRSTLDLVEGLLACIDPFNPIAYVYALTVQQRANGIQVLPNVGEIITSSGAGTTSGDVGGQNPSLSTFNVPTSC